MFESCWSSLGQGIMLLSSEALPPPPNCGVILFLSTSLQLSGASRFWFGERKNRRHNSLARPEEVLCACIGQDSLYAGVGAIRLRKRAAGPSVQCNQILIVDVRPIDRPRRCRDYLCCPSRLSSTARELAAVSSLQASLAGPFLWCKNFCAP